MPAATAVNHSVMSPGADDGNGFFDLVTGVLPASSPATFAHRLSSVVGALFSAQGTAAAATAEAIDVTTTPGIVSIAFDATAFASAKFTCLLFGKR